MRSPTTDGQRDYVSFEINYTTAEIAAHRLSGGTPDPFHFASPEPVTDIAPTILAVIDGEVHQVKDEIPPGAQLPRPTSHFFQLMEEAYSNPLI
jgi:hypothetical protein